MSVFWAVIFFAIVAMALASIDGARKVTALGDARDLADNAARAGAQQIDLNSSRDGTVELDPAGATNAASSYLAANGQSPDSVSVLGDTITVTVTVSRPGVLVSSVTGRATERATATQGG